MAKYVAFLRGMNLGGRRLGNPELCAAFEAIGMTEVSAFLASGNVVFAGSGSASALARRLEKGLEEELGYPVPTFLRTAQAVRALAESEPFGDRGASNGGKPQIAFLGRKPSAKAIAAVRALESDEDWLVIEGTELHWWPAGGISQSALDWKAVEKAVGPTTVRTRNTIERLVKKFLA